MPEYCTCGAKLPPDSRFCHKCGKPQFDEPGFQPAEPEFIAVPPPLPPALPPEISFHNRTAVRCGLLATFTAFLVMFLMPFPAVLPVIMVVAFGAAGFFAVFLYRKLSGHFVSIRGGARMGWITGVFSFTIALVLFTISLVYMSQEGGLAANFKQLAGHDPNVDEFVRNMDNPAYVAASMVFALMFIFGILTVLPVLGGALGAKVLQKD